LNLRVKPFKIKLFPLMHAPDSKGLHGKGIFIPE
jgi:hypothetical protein